MKQRWIEVLAIVIGLFGSIGYSNESCMYCVEPDFRTCTILAAGKKATADGSIITFQTADCAYCDFTFHLVPAQDHAPGSTRKIYLVSQYETFADANWTRPPRHEARFSGVEIPEVPHTHAYVHAIFGHMNDCQLQINESTISGRRELSNPNGIMTISELTMLAMERCCTAREAIQLMGKLAEEYGYAGKVDTGECLAVADKNEVWIFEIFGPGPLWKPGSGEPGAVWAARRVPDDEVCIVPNHSRIGIIDFNDPENFMYSSNVVSLAVKMGWYDPNSGEPFNWSKVYDPRVWSDGTPVTAANSNGYYGRLWRAYSLLAPSQNFSPDTPLHDFPFSIKPDKPLTMQDILVVLRDHYEGTPFDLTQGLSAGPFGNPDRPQRTARVENVTYRFPRPLQPTHTDYTTICISRDWLPDPIGGVIWIGLGEADTTCFFPIYIGVTELPESITIGNHWEFDRRSARWAFDYVDYHTMPFYSRAIKYVQEAQNYWENKAITELKWVDELALRLYEQNPDAAKKFLTAYCKIHLDQVLQAWWELGDRLLVYFNHGYDYTVVGKRQTISLPEWLLKLYIQFGEMKTYP